MPKTFVDIFCEPTRQNWVNMYHVKHGGGGVMIWACLVASEPGQLAAGHGTMNTTA